MKGSATESLVALRTTPSFYELQNTRRLTAKTQRVIQCAEDLPAYVGLPRGCGEGLVELLGEYGSTAEISDERQRGVPIDFRFRGELTVVQREAANALLANDIGMFVAPPGTLKTEVRIIDYVDPGVPMLMRMFEKRLRGYRAIGYARGGGRLWD